MRFYSNQSDEHLNQLLDIHQNENLNDYVKRYKNILTANEFLIEGNRTDIYYEMFNLFINTINDGIRPIVEVIQIIAPFVRFLGKCKCGITAENVFSDDWNTKLEAMVPILGMIEDTGDDVLYNYYVDLYTPRLYEINLINRTTNLYNII